MTSHTLSGQGRSNAPIDSCTEELGSRGFVIAEDSIAARPRRCLHIDLDFRDRLDRMDDNAVRYLHLLACGYFVGLRATREQQAAGGGIEILARGHVEPGNLYHDAYSHVSWRPS